MKITNVETIQINPKLCARNVDQKPRFSGIDTQTIYKVTLDNGVVGWVDTRGHVTLSDSAGGALAPLDHMLAPAKVISQFRISKWALQLPGSLTDLSERFVAQFPSVFAEPYRNELDPIVWLPWVVLAGFTAVMLLATILVQLRKDIH